MAVEGAIEGQMDCSVRNLVQQVIRKNKNKEFVYDSNQGDRFTMLLMTLYTSNLLKI